MFYKIDTCLGGYGLFFEVNIFICVFFLEILSVFRGGFEGFVKILKGTTVEVVLMESGIERINRLVREDARLKKYISIKNKPLGCLPRVVSVVSYSIHQQPKPLVKL